MRDTCIADEVIRLIPRENLFSLVSYCADGLHYSASPVFLSDLNLPAKIAVFVARSEFVENNVRVEVRELAQVVTVIATPIPPNMRVQIWCLVDWIRFAKLYGFGPSFTPCEVGADIMRYLLRMVEGNERADAWRPLPIKPSSELAPLLQPITLNWRISELKRWVEDYQSDTNADITFFHSPAKGYIDIYDVKPSPTIGMYCERPVNGAIELLPYILEGATPLAIAELQKWRDALEAAISERQHLAATADIVPVEDMPRTVGKPAENPERRKKKDTIRKLVMEGHTLRYIAENNIDIPYSTARLLRNELIEEGQLPQEVRKTRKKLGPNSI